MTSETKTQPFCFSQTTTNMTSGPNFNYMPRLFPPSNPAMNPSSFFPVPNLFVCPIFLQAPNQVQNSNPSQTLLNNHTGEKMKRKGRNRRIQTRMKTNVSILTENSSNHPENSLCTSNAIENKVKNSSPSQSRSQLNFHTAGKKRKGRSRGKRILNNTNPPKLMQDLTKKVDMACQKGLSAENKISLPLSDTTDVMDPEIDEFNSRSVDDSIIILEQNSPVHEEEKTVITLSDSEDTAHSEVPDVCPSKTERVTIKSKKKINTKNNLRRKSRKDFSLKKVSKRSRAAIKKRKEKITEEKALHRKLKIFQNLSVLLRPIVIDGSNVAIAHGLASHTFSAKGIQLCVDFFLKRGHTQVTAFVPQFRMNGSSRHEFPTVGQEILKDLAQAQHVVLTPSREINGKNISCYDDRFTIELASKNGGIIVSNDNFRDLMHESVSFKETIEKRLLMFVFVGDLFMVPDDPQGRHGPRLEEFLHF